MTNNTNETNNNNNGRKSNIDLIGICFKNINAYKRHRALAESARRDGDMDKAIYHELKQYKNIDGLELALRAIQSGLRDVAELSEDCEGN